MPTAHRHQDFANRGQTPGFENSGHLKRLRLAELEVVRGYFTPGLRVLEIGGGSGYQASVISGWGCEVISLDLGDRPAEQQRYYDVQLYDGEHIPFPDGGFELVFSSNVLEHVAPLLELFKEIRRVLGQTGRAIHIVPTPEWRFWTSLAHYGYLLKRLSGSSTVACAVSLPDLKQVVARRGFAYLLRRVLSAGPHGVYPTALSEIYYYSKRRWLRLFHEAGFSVTSTFPTGLFYTGYALAPRLSLSARRKIAKLLGSACRVFVMEPLAEGPTSTGRAPERPA